MKDFFRDIFEYHHYFNQKLIELLISNSTHLSGRIIPLMSHIVNAHQIWNSRILNLPPLGVHAVHTLEVCCDIDKGNFVNTMKILTEFDLEQKIAYGTSKGGKFENSIKEILFHIANHTTHHRGQIVMELRKGGIEPIMTDYIFYKR